MRDLDPTGCASDPIIVDDPFVYELREWRSR